MSQIHTFDPTALMKSLRKLGSGLRSHSVPRRSFVPGLYQRLDYMIFHPAGVGFFSSPGAAMLARLKIVTAPQHCSPSSPLHDTGIFMASNAYRRDRLNLLRRRLRYLASQRPFGFVATNISARRKSTRSCGESLPDLCFFLWLSWIPCSGSLANTYSLL